MTITNRETGEIITHADVRDSIAVARSHGEKFFEQIVWQVENEVWTILGYDTWDAMREAEYAGLGVAAPRADRPELVQRLRAKGLTQQQIGDTIGASKPTVSRILSDVSDETSPATITNALGQQRPSSYARQEPEPGTDVPEVPSAQRDTTPRRRPITDQSRDAGWELRKAVERIERIAADDRFNPNKQQVAAHLRSHLQKAIEVCQDLLDRTNPNEEI